MKGDRSLSELSLNPATEGTVRVALADHYEQLDSWDVEGMVNHSLSLAGASDRFAFLESALTAKAFSAASRCLVSGMSLGSEMLVARRQGFSQVHGVEVDLFFARLCARRLNGYSGLFPTLYDGELLPYAGEGFELVLSGHVIEHTADPGHYLHELLRVLRPGGYLLLEYPSRYHYRELHTGLPSVEWLPRPARTRLLRLLASRRSPLGHDVKHRLDAILDTGLQQIGMSDIARFLASAPEEATIICHHRPVPGVLRCVIQRAL